MSLPLPLAQAANFFSELITVYDTTTVLVLGREQNTQEPDRLIKGVIQVREDSMDIGDDGNISDGVFMLHTKETLSAYDTGEDGEIRRQTYVRFSQDVWKTTRIFDWASKTQGYNLYLLTRYSNTLGGL